MKNSRNSKWHIDFFQPNVPENGGVFLFQMLAQCFKRTTLTPCSCVSSSKMGNGVWRIPTLARSLQTSLVLSLWNSQTDCDLRLATATESWVIFWKILFSKAEHRLSAEPKRLARAQQYILNLTYTRGHTQQANSKGGKIWTQMRINSFLSFKAF